MSERPLVLVVDDDATGRRLVRATLTRAGFDVMEAADGRQAVDAFTARPPGLVLMDVSMPVMDGFTACAAMRELPGADRVPVVMMTGLDDVGSIERAFEVGATDFITKPISWPILAHRVRYILRASSAINDLEQNRRRLANAQRIGEMGDWEWDVRRNRIVPSDQARRIFGHDEAEDDLALTQFMDCVHEDDAQPLREACRLAASGGDGFSVEHRIVQAGGGTRHVFQQIEVVERDANGAALRLAGAVHDITRRKDAEEQVRKLAYYDTLTGLPNRLLFNELIKQSLARAQRTGLQVAVMFVDLDHFKRVNDTLGHGAGDELLQAVSARLAMSVRGQDSISRVPPGNDTASIARLGGDEFIVMLSELRGPSEAAVVAQRLVEVLHRPVTVQGNELVVSGSVGVAMFPNDGDTLDALLMNADAAMYRAKEAGRGGFEFYDRSMNASGLQRLVMESALRRAIERDEFVLHYQPRIDLASGCVVGAEALIRWQHPERGLVPPGEFIPLAEESRLIVPIGEWVIEAACRQSAAWREAGLGTVPLAVNLAASHLRERELPVRVAESMRRHGLAPGSLEIEVTESVLLTEPEVCAETARQLGEIGVKLSIDDFGTGYSSLGYLKRLPLASLKIDRSFVRDIATDADDAAIVTAIIAMAHTLKLRVVAEGVETPAQHAFLQAHGCDEVQGFLISKPVSADAFASWLQPARVAAIA